MILRKLTGLLSGLAVVAAGSGVCAQEPDFETLRLGRHFTTIFQTGSAGDVWSRMSEEMQAALGSLDQLTGFQASVRLTFGPQTEMLDEQTERHGAVRTYRRHATHASGAEVVWQWSFGPDDRIEGFYVRRVPEEAASEYLEYETRAELRLPFDGEWHVFWGGRTLEENYHAENPAQRFAYDFVVYKDGKSHGGSGARLTDYHCWDRPILAPAGGTVFASVDDLPDQAIGETDARRPAGNHVVLDLGEGEFVFLAHLRRGSVTVETGERVRSGQEIGRCGNSGNTSEPHLHMHLQTTPNLTAGEGLPAQFRNYKADGVLQERGEPVRGETVTVGN
ncbi:M23 family metallopeptidase [Nitratireductor kimnyeongensis]|uniref:M23 family metallopeptidase n=1 Tax=Nitratireductor kimnyeongensis TaxID=430679 RepID=A0ABW0TD66_9HYPH|nr:M23 family metallopeptidase [Nitratireductor kimnyeongensis]QZZ36793.1 M23 family metallopeptidase [Nitratireductor kimnyeongensis]